MRPSVILRVVIFLSAAWSTHADSVAAAAWRAIPPEEYAAERSPLDPSAGAVVLLREITIDNGDFDGAMQAYYVRIKVFDQKGIDALLRTEIPYEKGQRPRNIAARVVRPDGTAVEVEPKSIFTRDVLRVGREALRVKAFSFPALEPGCIIEYQYKIYTDDILLGMHVGLSDAHPVALARIRLKMLSIPGLGIQSIWSRQTHLENLERKDRGFQVFEGRDIAPVPDEPFSPPEQTIKPWFAFYFTPSDGSATDFWSYVAGELVAGAREYLAPKKAIKATATRLTAGINGDEAKLQRLYDFCRTEIKNLSHDASGYTPEEIEALKPNRTPVDTLNHRYGTDLDINLLFGALVQALGAKCSLAYCGDRSQFFFHRELRLRAALPRIVVAMPIGADWRFYDPGAMYLPCGELRWMNDGTSAIVIEGKFWRMIEIPRPAPEYSTTKRTAHLRLDENGTLEGDVTIELTGHDGIAAKHEFDARTDEERRDAVRDALVARLGQAEISAFSMRNVTDPNHPIQISYHVIAEGYAELTTDRIFVQPAFFQKGVPALFSTSERKNDIYFPYTHAATDDVTIELPSGFELEEPRAPGPVNVNHLVLYQPHLEYAKRSGRLIFRRDYTFYGETHSAVTYPIIKQALDRVAAQDAHRLALRRVATEPMATP